MRAETNMPVHVLLDASGSMRTAHGPCRKWSWACRAAAALVLCALRGRDPAGLVLLTDRVAEFLPARLGATQFPDALALLERHQPDGRSDLVAALNEARPLCRRRGLVILISDLFTADPEADRAVSRELGDWQASGQDVLVIHVLDPVETDLPAHGRFLTRDLESTATVRADAATVRDAYRALVARWRDECRSAAESTGIDWLPVTTADPIADTLAATLARRSLLTK
jgi:uncharacterized protein (DUF58 family)